MSCIRTVLLAATASLIVLDPAAGATGDVASASDPRVVIADFAVDPTLPHGNSAVFFTRGSAAAFQYEPATAARFTSDTRGSLRTTYDSTAPTSRFFSTFPGGFTQDDDFVLGAVLTIRPEGFAADPFGFHPISFSLFNASTTGDDRTGDPSDFAADTFDTLELSYFPNESPFFGGPFLSFDVFGQQVAPDAFASFTFATVPVELEPGITYLVEMEHSALARTLTCQVSRIRSDGAAIPQPGGPVVVDLSGLSGFLVDSLGVSAYHDGFNIFSSSGRSLYAVVDYDLLYSGPKVGGELPSELARALKKFVKRTSRLVPVEPPLQ